MNTTTTSKGKHVNETRVHVAVVSLVAWFASFAAIGLSAFALYGRAIYYVFVFFLVAIVIAIAAGGHNLRDPSSERIQVRGIQCIAKEGEGGWSRDIEEMVQKPG